MIFNIGNLVIGLLLVLIGFRVYNPFKGKNPEQEEEWYKSYGMFFKIAGILILLFGLLKLFLSR